MKKYIKNLSASVLLEKPQYIDEDDGTGLTDQSIFTFEGGEATVSEYFINKGYYYIARIKFESGDEISKTFKDRGLYDDSARKDAVEWVESRAIEYINKVHNAFEVHYIRESAYGGIIEKDSTEVTAKMLVTRVKKNFLNCTGKESSQYLVIMVSNEYVDGRPYAVFNAASFTDDLSKANSMYKAWLSGNRRKDTDYFASIVDLDEGEEIAYGKTEK